MQYVVGYIILIVIGFSGCAKRSDGFAPSTGPVDQPSIPPGPTDEAVNSMKVAIRSEVGSWVIVMNHTDIAPTQIAPSGWEVEIVHD